jgi:hypothetical protein
MGMLIWTCLLVAAGQAPDDVFYTNQLNHRVPINIQPTRRPEIRELRLFVSSDKGAKWQQVSTITPEKDGFVFFGQGDGEYWLCPATVNRLGKQDPENIYKAPHDQIQKMVIDRLKPAMKLVSPQRQGDEISVGWEIQEEHPNPKTLKLEYRSANDPNWTAVPVTPGPTGQARFRAGPGAVSIRMQFQDLAGNASSALAEVPGLAVTAASFTPASTPAPVPPPAQQPTTSGPIPSGPAPAGTPPANAGPPPVPPPGGDVHAPPPLRSDAATPSSGPGTGAPSASVAQGPIADPQPAVTPRPGSGPDSSTAAPNRLVASSERAAASSAGPPTPERNTLPPQQYVNHKEMVLEYEVVKFGPSGIGSVDLWWTQDDGKTWLRAPDPEQPDETHKGRSQRPVKLFEDGVYGFRLVVRNRAGVGKQPPRAGDVPEMRVELDTMPPLAKLFEPRPDPDRRDALLLTWSAKDKNLNAHPITLEWAEKANGTWQTIAADLANTGQYSWQLPSAIPPHVFLRLRVRDLAGNESVAVTAEPQIVDLTEPEAHLINVSKPPSRP